ncbi:MAG: hypothetical protein ABI889_02530 [Gemmatimonadota bacterium]
MRAVVVAVAVVSTSVAARAQASSDPAMSSPHSAVNAVFDAMLHKQWARVAALSDSAFLTQWRDQQLVYANADKIERDNKKKNQKQYGLPKCVQKYFESQESNYSDTFLKGFAGAKSISQLETFTPEQLFASWLAGGDAVKSNSRNTTRTILGEVPESEYVTHLIYRMTPPPPSASDDGVERITVRRYNGEWHVVPNDDIRLAGRSYSWQSSK